MRKTPGGRLRPVPFRPKSARAKVVCPIVGVGASAGGLEAFSQLLNQLPVDTGFGFVFVQHLDPQHESVLAKLLERATRMPVQDAANNLRVEPNHVYVIPPNTSLGIAHGVLKLQPRSAQRNRPARTIDFFLEALAKDQHGRAIGVILSGTATDGTLGLEAIKAEGGITFAQDASARYDSMPRSAAAAGCVDLVLSPANIARELARIAKHPYVAGGITSMRLGRRNRTQAADQSFGKLAGENSLEEGQSASSFNQVLSLLRSHAGVDFSLYKTSTIQRRIARRTVLSKQKSSEGYVNFLRGNAKELDALFSDALISVTSFFRNADTFAALQHKVLQPMLALDVDEPVRIWVLGCSTGQEPYSIAMAFAEVAAKVPHSRRLQIFATDLNETNLDKARHGFYSKGLVEDVSPARLQRFFTAEDGGYRIVKSLREQVVFARHNLMSDPPFSRMDLISCRNVMIYLEPSLQKKLLQSLHYALKPEGFLLLGASESVGAFPEMFEQVDKKHKIFTRKTTQTTAFPLQMTFEQSRRGLPRPSPRAVLPRSRDAGGAPNVVRVELSAEREADRITVNQFAPPSVLIDADLQILQFRGSTSEFLEPPTGKASFNLLKMTREGLMLPLRAAIIRAKKGNQTVRIDHLPVTLAGRTREVSVEVVPLKNLKERRYLILFSHAKAHAPALNPESPIDLVRSPSHPGRKAEFGRITALERDLAETRDYLQSIQEYQEAANEELQASNEEGQSANEELQSLNEELETSKEELESTNEELTTVNEEMAIRNSELNRLYADLTNLQTSANLVIVLLGRDLTIRRFTSQAEAQFHLTASDIGRPVGSIKHNLQLPDLPDLVAGVIGRVQECEREIQAHDGRWYSLRVRPYIALDNKVDGAVLVLMDIDALKKTEWLITEAHEHAAAIIRTVPNPLVILDAQLRLKSANQSFYRIFKLSAAETKERSIFELDRGCWNNPRLHHLLKEILPKNSLFDDFEITHNFTHVGRRTLLLNARMLVEPGGKAREILLGIQDITERKLSENALADAQAKLTQHAAELESVVTRRTAELTATNRRLESSVASVRRSQEEFRTLFLESQKMQKQLRQLTRQILTVQEEERKSISRELHDEVVQTLISINVELAALGKLPIRDRHVLQQKITHTQHLLTNSVNTVHRFARELRPAVLDDLGLIPALHAFCRELGAQRTLKIQMTAFGGVEMLGSAERTILYRVAQEALNNVARHAHATRIRLSIKKIPKAVQMMISDNGKSFPVQKVLKTGSLKHLGLIGMKERIEMVGGILTIESAPGKGTTVRAEIPFNPKKAKK